MNHGYIAEIKTLDYCESVTWEIIQTRNIQMRPIY